MLKKLLAAIALACALAAPMAASAAKRVTMSKNFVDDWCRLGDGYDAKTRTTNYGLPSWAGETCTKIILSVDRHGFYFSDTGERCDLVSARYTSEQLPADKGGYPIYTAKIKANCSPSGAGAPKLKTFEFERWKGWLDVKKSDSSAAPPMRWPWLKTRPGRTANLLPATLTAALPRVPSY